MQSQTFQKLNRIVFKMLVALIKSNLIRPFVMDLICSTGLIRVNNSRITKDKKSVFAPLEAQFSDKKSELFVIIFKTLIFNLFQNKSRTIKSDRFAIHLHNVNKRSIAVTRHRSWSFIR